jgi:hypothetical protein
MAEMGHVGAHCFMKNCNQQDFLPFTCDHCTEITCGDHRRPEDHKCAKGSLETNSLFAVICPLCDMNVRYRCTGNHKVSSPEHELEATEALFKHEKSKDCEVGQ